MKDLKKNVLKKILLIAICSFIISSLSAQLPTAQEVAAKMKIGWNLGNTLEAVWGNPGNTSQRVIDSVKAAGFNTVRLPCAWEYHATDGVIDTTWMAYVKRVVDYCIKDTLYTMINIHWDNGWLDEHINKTDQPVIIEKQKKYWTQIANYFKDYDEHLLFASANEPPVNENDTAGMAILMSYHQAFVDAVRATGGNNSSRSLIIQAPNTNIERAYTLMNTWPTDSIESRLMLEVHYYSPYPFCLMTEDASWGKMAYYWGSPYHSSTDKTRNLTWGEEVDLDKSFQLTKTKFTDNGIPVILGEFGAIKREQANIPNYELHRESIKYYNNYVAYTARKYGMVPVYWDNAWIDFEIFNRATGAIKDRQLLDGLMLGADGIVRTDYIRLVNSASGLVIDCAGNSAVQSSKDSALSQQWVLETVADYVRIKNRATGLFLDDTGASADNTNDNQKWVEEFHYTYVKFKNKATGLYLDGLGNTENGSVLGYEENSTSSNQKWAISSIIDSPALPKPNSTDIQTIESNIELYPNPYSTTFTLEINNPEDVLTIDVFNMIGKKVDSFDCKSVPNTVTMGASLQKGVHLLCINYKEGIKTFKIIRE